jgi:hypothetical protein
MNKFVKIMLLVAIAALAVGTTGVAYAQTPGQASGSGAAAMGGRGPRGGNGAGNGIAEDGILHDYMIAAYAEALNIPVADLEARLDNGETMSQIALSTGLTLAEFRTLMVDVRTQSIDQALADGVLTQAQADWLKLRGAGQMAGGQMGRGFGMNGAGQGQNANPNCPYFNSTNP